MKLHQVRSREVQGTEKSRATINDVQFFEIFLASPDEIKQMAVPQHLLQREIERARALKGGKPLSRGEYRKILNDLVKSREVTKPDTINYRHLRPEVGGLFCERIFGPVRDFECACGKNHRGGMYMFQVCPNCGVEATWARVRRERMGYIELASPVVNPVYAYGSHSIIALLLGVSARALEPVISYMAYIVIDPGNSDFKRLQIIDEIAYRDALRSGVTMKVGIGVEAIEELLAGIDLEALAAELRRSYQETRSRQYARRIARRLQVVESFLASGIAPTHMILRVLPVIPPDLRPMIRLDGGKFATSDLNELYRRVISRNNRLKHLLEIHAPDVITRNEKRLLQEAVDALFINSRKRKPVMNNGKRPLRSLSDLVSGKQGRFRQNLLGKRVDYSGRSVIVVGPHLRIDQVGLPKEMALELFKPMVMRELIRSGYAHTDRHAKRRVEQQDPIVWDMLERVVKEHPVLLNRAPTLHRLSIQAFEPVLVDGRAIQLHPLVCAAYNADFDGDQMAVHVPLSAMAQAEARLLILSSRNLLDPKNGLPIVKPDKDMTIGLYTLTMPIEGAKGSGKVFGSPRETLLAYKTGKIDLNAPVWVCMRDSGKPLPENRNGDYLLTTAGNLLFNELFPDNMPFVNGAERLEGVLASDFAAPSDFAEGRPLPRPVNSGAIRRLVTLCIEKLPMERAAKIVDGLKDLGFRYATLSGCSLGLTDLNLPAEKQALIANGDRRVHEIHERLERGELTDDEAYQEILRVWEDVNARLTDAALNTFDTNHPLHLMLASGARANPTQVRQLVGWRGIMADPSGRAIEIPIRSSFREGLDVLEYFISTHGARKGQADTALKTADSGYLTRRLVDVAHDVIVREYDCGTDEAVLAEPRVDLEGRVIVPLEDVLFGRVLALDVKVDDQIIAHAGEVITRDLAEKLAAVNVPIYVRTVLTCHSEHGVCALCYGMDLGRKMLVNLGEAVGIVAAQSIGEPGTQLTMRTFHTGGVAAADITQGLPRVEELFEARNPKIQAVIATASGRCCLERDGSIDVVVIETEDGQRIPHQIPYGRKLQVANGDWVEKGQPLNDGSLNLRELLQLRGVRAVENYVISDIQRVYREQGVNIHDKHIEIIVRQMLAKGRILSGGDTGLPEGAVLSRKVIEEANAALSEDQEPATYQPLVLGITKASLLTNSFLSAASFQQTTRMLAEAAIAKKRDPLTGLKESVIVGKLIPAGTGLDIYHRMLESQDEGKGGEPASNDDAESA